MILDLFPLGYETDVLLIRLRTLRDVVDGHVIVEGDRTFTGEPREPLWPQLAGLSEFVPFGDRVIHKVVKLPENLTPWQREMELRGALLPLADEAADISIDRWKYDVIISDADEIPNPLAITAWRHQSNRQNVWRLPGYYHQLRLNLRAKGSLDPEYLWEFRQPLLGPRWSFRHAETDRAAQRASAALPRRLYGWHLSCQGTPADITRKLRAYSHTELADLTTTDVARHIHTRTTIGHGVPLEQVALADLPPAVQQDPVRFGHLMTAEPR